LTNSSLPAPLAEQFPPLSNHEALVEAHRCLYCYDAPCTHACPTHIDIPRFIKKIATDNMQGSAKTILASNLLGATCARVCPVQELCEGACVLGAEHKPIAIGRLQRHAMDHAYSHGVNGFLKPGEPTGKRVAVIGAGPAGLSCAGELARRGHGVTIYEKRELPGGLSTYGIIVLREPIDIALAEAEMIRKLGVKIETGVEAGLDITAADLQTKFDAVFLSVGLGMTPSLGIPGEEHVLDGLDYISRSKLDSATLQPGRNVLVIGAGNTAIDCATVAKRIGSQLVTMVYRRTERHMTAYDHEYSFVKNEGVAFEFLAQPVRVLTADGQVIGLECVRTRLTPHPEPVEGSAFVLAADQIVKAIGQHGPSIASQLGLATERGLISVSNEMETSVAGIFAGGDCIRVKGAASTVMAVQDGKLAAAAIHNKVMANG
jgi:dihydropyrimidine dehydrogenase (NAD+) subunit PreT